MNQTATFPLTPATSSKPKSNSKPKAKNKNAAMPSTATMRFYLTVAMGVSLPLLSLTLSFIGGNLARNADSGVVWTLAIFAFGLMSCVLAVSLSHLAWAVRDITRSPQWASWALAVSFDLALVLGELCHISADAAGIGLVVTLLMCSVCTLSMFLNCWAFLRHPAVEAKLRRNK